MGGQVCEARRGEESRTQRAGQQNSREADKGRAAGNSGPSGEVRTRQADRRVNEGQVTGKSGPGGEVKTR